MTIEITGVPKVLENLKEYQGRILQALVSAAEVSQARIVNDARANHPYTDRTQNLTNSIQAGLVRVTEEGVEAYVEARMEYASYVEFGTSRSKPYPFLTPAMLRESPNYIKTAAKLIDRIKL